jgi:hypothetical protein
MNTTPPITSTRQLHYNADTKEYVGEISSTNGFGRVHADSCDEGMALQSARTGRKCVFVVCHTERGIDGDVAYWILEPLSTIGAGISHVSVRLFND